MRTLAAKSLTVGALVLGGCASDASDPTGRTSSTIGFGAIDTTHTAVVSLLAPDNGGRSFVECSGTIVQVKDGKGYVLTAAHCCNMTVPTIVVMANDYTVGEEAVFGGTPTPPSYAVDAKSVFYDASYVGDDHDFCMLTFAAPAITDVLALPTGDDELTLGAIVEHVGFGESDTDGNNSKRRHGAQPVDKSLTASALAESQDGTNAVAVGCEGDSGGPALFPANVPPSQQTIVGVISKGATPCGAKGDALDSRVTSEIGPGLFITRFLEDQPIGVQANAPPATCDACLQAATQSACALQASACESDVSCTSLDACVGNCSDPGCTDACDATAGTNAVGELQALGSCLCDQACKTECASSPACTAPAGSGGAGGNAGAAGQTSAGAAGHATAGAAGQTAAGAAGQTSAGAAGQTSAGAAGHATAGAAGQTAAGAAGHATAGAGGATKAGVAIGAGNGGAGAAAPPATTDDGGSSGGCAIANGPASRAPLLWTLAVAVAGWLRRRKRIAPPAT